MRKNAFIIYSKAFASKRNSLFHLYMISHSLRSISLFPSSLSGTHREEYFVNTVEEELLKLAGIVLF